MSLGSLAARYVSGGDPGAVFDNGGSVCYGVYRFAAGVGMVQEFVRWLKGAGYVYAAELTEAVAGSDAFSAAWRRVAAADPAGFLAAQQRYGELVFYQLAKRRLEDNWFYADKHSEAIGQVIFSAAVEYSSFYLPELFFTACNNMGFPNLSYIDAAKFDAELIGAVYEVRASDEWTAHCPEFRSLLRKRYKAECGEALAMLG